MVAANQDKILKQSAREHVSQKQNEKSKIWGSKTKQILMEW
jgi:hypothetical protein